MSGRRKSKSVSAAAVPRAKRRAYEAGKVDRLSADWIFSHSAADVDIKGGLATIRARARELEQNNDFARKYLSMVEQNVVGRGFALTIPSIKAERAKAIVAAFYDWMDRAEVSGLLSRQDVQRMAARTVARDGEQLVRFYRGASYADGLGFQMLESDHLDETHNTRSGDTLVTMGVYTEQTRPVAYSIFKDHPGADYARGQRGREKVDAADIIHIYRKERPSQTRAVSWMASSMKALRMLYGYMEAELVAARISSCKMGFYKIPPGEDFTSDDKDSAISDAAPGVFERMPTGWEFQPFDPAHPTSQFGQFVSACLRQIAGGLNVAYNNFANDLEKVSYSSIRSGTIDERENWIVVQQWFSRAFLARMFDEWVKSAAIVGTAGIRASEADKLQGASVWTGRRWPWVDPSSDIQAKKEEIALGLTAPSIIAAESGNEFAAIQAALENDNETRRERGLTEISRAGGAVQDTALNGAQITAAIQMLQAAATGTIPVAAVGPMLKASFPGFDDAQIASITGPLKSFKPPAGTAAG